VRGLEQEDFDRGVAALQQLHDEGVVTIDGWDEKFPAGFFDSVKLRNRIGDTDEDSLRELFVAIDPFGEHSCDQNWYLVVAQKYGNHSALAFLKHVVNKAVFGEDGVGVAIGDIIYSPGEEGTAQFLLCSKIRSACYHCKGYCMWACCSDAFGLEHFDAGVDALQQLHDEGVITIAGWDEALPPEDFSGVPGLSGNSYSTLHDLLDGLSSDDDWQIVVRHKFGELHALEVVFAVVNKAFCGLR
jgi:hypothetical protein